MSLHHSHTLMGLAFALLLLGGCAPRILPDPLTPDEHVRLGLACEYQGDTERAKAEYAKAKTPLSAFYLGNINAVAGVQDEALRHYRTALFSMADDPLVNNNMAWLLLAVGQSKRNLDMLLEAEMLAERAVKGASPEILESCKDTLERAHYAVQRERDAMREDEETIIRRNADDKNPPDAPKVDANS